jgi:outer membrane protein insertion porin family
MSSSSGAQRLRGNAVAIAAAVAVAILAAAPARAQTAPGGPPPVTVPDRRPPAEPQPTSPSGDPGGDISPPPPGPPPDAEPTPVLIEPPPAEPGDAGEPTESDEGSLTHAVDRIPLRSIDTADASFGPLLVIEGIEVFGNGSTADRVIRRALQIRAGDMLRPGDPRLERARYKVLALGFFRDVQLRLRRGSARGQVILVVEVVERGTMVLERLYFGTSTASPWWAGAVLSERNFLGTGLTVGGGFVYAGSGDVAGSEDQWATELRVSDPSIGGSRVGAHGSLLWAHASEPYRTGGDPSDDAAADFAAFGYRRAGGRAGITYDLTSIARLSVDGRLEFVDADPPAAPTRTLPDGTIVPVDIGLQMGESRVATLSLGLDRDTRPDPILPYTGDRLQLLGELGATFLGGSYDFGTLLARYQRWWPVSGNRHVVSMHLTGGLVLGEAPRFDRLHVADFNRLLTPRALGLVVATTPSHDLLGTSTEEVTYGEIGGSAVVEYSYQLFRSRRRVYGGDLFIGAGLWALASSDALQVRDRSLYRALPVDLIIDAGLRIDTEIGVFELTLANALGRVPL